MTFKPLLFLFSWLMVASAATINRTETMPGCQSMCGNIAVPFPFGIGEKCSIEPWANIICNTTLNPPKPFIGSLEVVEFSLTEVRIRNFLATTCYTQTGSMIQQIYSHVDLLGTPYTFSSTQNKIAGIGCDTIVTVVGSDAQKYSSGCTSVCDTKESVIVIEGSCSGIGCCEVTVPKGLKEYYILVGSLYNHTRVWSFDPCGTAFMGEQSQYTFTAEDFTSNSSIQEVPIVLNFGIGNKTCTAAKQNSTSYACKNNSNCYDSTDDTGYLCSCNEGYTGNPYLDPGCQDVNECEDPNDNPCRGICSNTEGSYNCSCPSDSYGDGTKEGSGCTRNDKRAPVLELSLGLGFGFLFILVGGSWLYLSLKKRKLVKMKEKFFQQNGGLLLKQRISSKDCGVESTKIFTAKELKLATNNYSEHRILGEGGNGTVYKGVLPDLKIVAIKKSKVVNKSQLGQFINEVVILTQVNHRNVVKLLGCCLETEVPLLVYEFVSNGTLSYHLHKKGENKYALSWDDRVRIAAETAGALSYLHSAAHIPIIHRDVKSANILLDDNYTAKVADFGASRLNPLDETQINTLVQGTLGYLDPEYFDSGQLTEKSDVYSFGVVLAELLTGEKHISFERSQDQRNLAIYFVSSIKENRLSQLLEAEIIDEGNSDEVHGIAVLAKRCLGLVGEGRPSMKEVAAYLEGLRRFEKRQWTQKGREEMTSIPSEADLYPIPRGTYSSSLASEQSSLVVEMIQSMQVPR